MNGNDLSDDNNNNYPNNGLSNLLTRTTIREANIHLQLLHSRNQELQKILETQQHTIKRQADALIKKDQDYLELYKNLGFLELHCENLQSLLNAKDKRLASYDRKDAIFSETLELRPAIEQLLDILNTFEQVDQTEPVKMNNSIQHSTNHSSTKINLVTSNNTPLEFVQSRSSLIKHTDNGNSMTDKITTITAQEKEQYHEKTELLSQSNDGKVL
ncbi:unnamed protein product [Didymodactylos carnosus]|uniref:Uncharacterized protein n=1 Tax=Didymodactylos carnosus TaxID=1234261 RepID=A0A814JAD8_9BILA|nr:unnamed protein product [Didymodactylos carnosus]CAF1034795.1 unnamed protein product [Didymodactylos carnosus]CAF3705809.1 unnamed protein product [Didymodactylos carnosus]CAF3805452.1 unnamed protein product [Didymodactylos carnosus]